jgi:hypothetical protein
MSSHTKIDERAFNRGVEEVLLLKPLVRIVRQVIAARAPQPKPAGKGRAHDGKTSRKAS